ncbi:unnamed protein product, partial [Prorocentrum cordatum]
AAAPLPTGMLVVRVPGDEYTSPQGSKGNCYQTNMAVGIAHRVAHRLGARGQSLGFAIPYKDVALPIRSGRALTASLAPTLDYMIGATATWPGREKDVIIICLTKSNSHMPRGHMDE